MGAPPRSQAGLRDAGFQADFVAGRAGSAGWPQRPRAGTGPGTSAAGDLELAGRGGGSALPAVRAGDALGGSGLRQPRTRRIFLQLPAIGRIRGRGNGADRLAPRGRGDWSDLTPRGRGDRSDRVAGRRSVVARRPDARRGRRGGRRDRGRRDRDHPRASRGARGRRGHGGSHRGGRGHGSRRLPVVRPVVRPGGTTHRRARAVRRRKRAGAARVYDHRTAQGEGANEQGREEREEARAAHDQLFAARA